MRALFKLNKWSLVTKVLQVETKNESVWFTED